MRFLLKIVGTLILALSMTVIVAAQEGNSKQTKQITVCPFEIAPAGRAASFRISFPYQLEVDSAGSIKKVVDLKYSRRLGTDKFVRHDLFVECMKRWKLEPAGKYTVYFYVGTTSIGIAENMPFNYMRIVDPDKKVLIFELSHSESDLLKINEPVKLAQGFQNKCREWQLRIEPKTSFYFRNDDDKTQEEIFEGIECLLKLKGRKHGSNLSGPARSDVSQFFTEPTSVEVAALYYITYLVYQKWDHADAPYLVNKKGKLNTSKSVSEAYKAYRTWIKTVKDLGLEETRKQKLNPLAGLAVSWY